MGRTLGMDEVPLAALEREWRSLVRGQGLLLDHRSYDQHVVRRQVLRARVAEVDALPVLAERVELLLHKLRVRRRAEELVGRRKEKAFLLPDARANTAWVPGRRDRREIAVRREVGLRMPLVRCDLSHRAHPLCHLTHGESFREDDVERLRHRDHRFCGLAVDRPRDRGVDERARGRRGRRGLGFRLTAADRRDGEPPETAEREHEHGDRGRAATDHLTPRRTPWWRRTAFRRHHARAPLDHSR